MAAVSLDLTIYQGETFRQSFTWNADTGTPVDLTGASARMQARKTASSDTVLLDLTTANNGITLGGAAGTIALLASSVATAALAWEYAVYDLFVTLASGDEVIFACGCVTVTKRVTR